MSNTPEMGANLIGQVAEGTPVYDVNGERVGHVSKQIMEGDNIILHKGLIFPKDLYIPLSIVRRSDSNGVSLSITKDELQHERYTALSPHEERASVLGMEESAGRLQGADTGERHQHTVTRGEDVYEAHPDTIQRGADTIETRPESIQRGADTIETHPDTFTQGTTNIEYPEEDH